MSDRTDIASRSTVLITGCSTGGLGEALAFAFHRKGLRVLATARSTSAMQALQAAGLETFELDVTKADSIAVMYARVDELTGGKLDILVNNAGQSYPYPVSDISMDKARAVFDVNFFGPLAMIKTFLPLLLASDDARIVNVGSTGAIMPVPWGGIYGATKAALHSLGDTLRLELAPFNIKVLTITIGNVDTQIVNRSIHLQEDSMYFPINEEFRAQRIDHFMDGAPSPDSVARKIVSEALTRRPRAWLWGGKNAWLFWFIHTFLGRRGFDWIFSKHFGLTKLAKIVARQKKTQ